MHTCESCGKKWPDNYCPECARTLGPNEPPIAPPPLPQRSLPSKPPPILPLHSSSGTRKKSLVRWSIGLGLVMLAIVAGSLAYRTFQSFIFPPGYRNRPTSGWGTRAGEKEFSRADNQIDSFQGTSAFGNSPEAIKLAQQFSESFKTARALAFTPGFKIEILDHTKGEFITYCELHNEECAFIVHVPQLRKFEENIIESVDARKLLAQLAWTTAQGVLKEQSAGKPKMELAVGLRGISQYGPIMLGHYEANARVPKDGLIKYLDDGAQTHFLWTFFAPEGDARRH